MLGALTISQAAEDGFRPLFNGRDLAGWVNANCAPETWSVRDGVIHCTGKPTGGLRTDRQYENFILELEWRHLSKGGNSGVFIWATPIAAPGVPFLRGVEVQVLDNDFNIPGKNEWYTTHGDVFPIHGATMKPFGRHNGSRSFPSEERSKGSPEWNHYRVTATNGVLRLEVNGKEVSGGEECNYRKGYLGLESEGAPVEFRNVRIRELPGSGAPPEQTAPLDQGWKPLFTGLDLRGWHTNEATAARWQVAGEHLNAKPGAEDAATVLWTAESYGEAEFIIDCQPAKAAENTAPAAPQVFVCGMAAAIKLTGAEPGKYQRFRIRVKNREVTIWLNDKETQRVTLSPNDPLAGPFGLANSGAAAQFMNLYVHAP
jgi:hypothetical protein